jgi:hypothetical protein
MGRNKFGPQRGPWENLDWQGWWGDTPPFHTPVFVLTHHHRPSFTLADTTFHFLDATPAEALHQATDAAEGKDVRLGGGVATVRQFLEADLVDTMHVAVAPVELCGRRPTNCLTGSTASPCRAPAASRTDCSGVGSYYRAREPTNVLGRCASRRHVAGCSFLHLIQEILEGAARAADDDRDSDRFDTCARGVCEFAAVGIDE